MCNAARQPTVPIVSAIACTTVIGTYLKVYVTLHNIRAMVLTASIPPELVLLPQRRLATVFSIVTRALPQRGVFGITVCVVILLSPAMVLSVLISQINAALSKKRLKHVHEKVIAPPVPQLADVFGSMVNAIMAPLSLVSYHIV